jgi:hypothetical protein
MNDPAAPMNAESWLRRYDKQLGIQRNIIIIPRRNKNDFGYQ